MKLQGIFVPTDSGHTATVLSATRPSSPLLGVSDNIDTCQKLALHWGAIPIHMKKDKVRDWQVLSQKVCDSYKLTKTGNRVLLVSGFNDNDELNEPVLKIIRVNKR